MKTLTPALPGKHLLSVLACLGCAFSLHAASGELDLTFDPSPEEVPYFPSVAVNGSEVYIYSMTNVLRLLPNGRIDPGWSFAAPLTNNVLMRFGAFPDGGWYALGSPRSYFESADHSVRQLPSSFIAYPGNFPHDEGGLIVATTGGAYRFTREGVLNPTYSDRSVFKAVTFKGSDGSFHSGVSVVPAMDSRGRLIVGGNFTRAGLQERMTLARILPDGTVDPGWNPGAQLDLSRDGEGFLNASPRTVAVGPTDSVLVEYLYGAPAPQDRPPRYLVWIDSAGNVTGKSVAAGTFHVLSKVPNLLIQPDGKIIAPGIRTWDGTSISAPVRLEHDGSLDTSWKLTMDDYSLFSLAFDSSGGLMMTGSFTTVNGVPRPGIARVQAYDPPAASLQAEISAAHPRVTTNETLRLTARVGGYPPPSLQWYRNGEPIAGATNRGLEFGIRDANSGGVFHLTASNEAGIKQLDFPAVTVTERSPVLGPAASLCVLDRAWGFVHQLLVQPDGKILACFGDYNTTPDDAVMLARLMPEGALDPSFGEGGIVRGTDHIESMRLLPDGGILVAGALRKLGGREVSGLAELDAQGHVKPLSFPELDIHFATAALKLSDGRYVLAGGFTKVGGADHFRLARLTPDLQIDASFNPQMDYWQMVSDLAEDAQGRLLIAGGGVYFGLQGGSITNPVPVGVRRLLSNGAIDPEFAVSKVRATKLFVEPEGTILAGTPNRRLNDRGELITEFLAQSALWYWPVGSLQTDHRVIALPGGGLLSDSSSQGDRRPALARWDHHGGRNYDFTLNVFPAASRVRLDCGTIMPDGSALLGIVQYVTNMPSGTHLVRVAPDFDLHFSQTQKTEAGIRASILTQPGFHYTVRQRPNLSGPAGAVVAELEGDGYRQDVVIPDSATTGFLEYVRE